MKKYWAVILFMLLLVSPMMRAQYYGSTPEGGGWNNSEYKTTEGTDFWVTYMFNYGNLQQDVNLKLYLYAVAREQTTFQIHYSDGTTSPLINVPAGGRSQIFTVDQSKAYITDPDIKMSKGMHVTSGKPISLYALNQNAEAGSYDATNILPTKTLGREYVIQTYTTDGVATEFALLGTKNYTQVEIDYYEKHVETGNVTRNTISVTLNAGETYLHRSSGIEYSLTGTTVCASQPIAIFCGGQHADIPRGSSNKNHIYSQLYPASMWGKHFVVQNIHEHKKDFYRVTAAQNSTTVRVNGTLVATLKSNETYDGVISSPTHANVADYIETNKNALVYFYATDGVLSNDTVPNPANPDRPFITSYEGAPAMAPVVPMELGCRNLIFSTLKSPGITKHYVNIVTYKAYKNGMRLDGANISGRFTDIGTTPYCYAQIQLTDTAHTLLNTQTQSQNAVFSAIVYGLGMNNMGRQESYAYAPGSRIFRDADMLINNAYIKEKTICINQPLNFTAVIGGDYSTVTWDFQDYAGTTTGNTDIIKTHLFSEPGNFDVTMTVGRQYPINCTNTGGSMVYDTVHATIHVKDMYNAYFHRKICEGESVTLRGRDENGQIQEFTYNTDYTDTKHFYTIDGCDSIVDVKIEVGYPKTVNLSHTECVQYTWHGTTYKSSGQYEWTTKTAYNCDSTEILDLTILQPVEGPLTEITICANSSYDWNGQHITKAGDYTARLTAANGCDSIAKLRVKIEKEYKEEKTVKLCYGQSYTWRGRTLTEANTYTDLSPSPQGCDSTFILHLSFYPDYTNMQITAQTCADQPYRFGDEYLTESGIYTKSFTSKAGCDSIVTLTLTVWPLGYDTIRASICQGEKYSFGGKQLSTSGEYTKTESNTHGCTKTTVLYLTVNPNTHKYDTVRTCERDLPYTYAGKYTATKAGDYTQVLDVKNHLDCDSIYHLHLIVDKNIITSLTIHQCDYDGAYSHPDSRATNLQNLTKTGTYRDTLTAVNGCDSILELHLNVGKRTYYDLLVEKCDNDLPWRDVNKPSLELYRDTVYKDTILNQSECDSVITVTFKVYPTSVDTIDVTICESETPYNHPDTRFTLLQNLNQTQTVTQTIQSVHGCDSTITLRLTVLPTTYNHQYVSVCEEKLPYAYGDHGGEANETGEYTDVLDTKNQYGCDSVLVLHLTVMSTIIDKQSVELCDDQLPYNHPDVRATKLQNLTQTGTYRDTLISTTGCDSIIELQFQVWNTYEHYQYDTICDDGSFNFHGHVFENLTARETPYTLDSIFPSVHGCDSMVHFFLMVYPTYKIPTATVTVCQDRNNPEWKWRDEDGTLHGTVSIADSGEVFLADTLHTIHGCDSIFGMQLRIIPSYHFDSLYSMCQNERIEWQGKSYCGDSATTQTGDRTLSPGLYKDTVKWQTSEGCDSIFYLQLQVYPIYHTDVTMTVCDNEDNHAFNLQDTKGTIIQDVLPFEPSPSEVGVTKETQYINRDYSLKTIHGCDSIVHLHLTVYPTYEFVSRAKICGTEDYMWRGKMYYETGTYYDSLQTKDGCDSVYVLELYKKPMLLIPIFDTICDNETYEHYDTLWYTNGTHVLVETMVWTPGMKIPQSYTDVTFRSADDGCDSVVYRYYLQINKTYIYFDTATICSNESYETEAHVYTGYEHEYDVDNYIAPYDTVVKNEYLTQTGCDSVYHLKATIYPMYRHRDTITVCDNESATWRGHQYSGVTAGEYVFYDSLKTRDHDCDSIYELYLVVHSTYLFEERTAKCADEDMTWHAINMDHLLPGEYFYFDSLQTSTFGCDSVYHLYLTVNDTTREERYDTICRTETYDFHGVPLTEPGYYYDTTLNELGCHHFTHLFLEVIEPTVPTAWTDSICADEDAYDLFYTYTGDLDPVAYSLYYDDEGHLNGFEDIENQPITTPDELSWLRIPMPRVDDDRTKYPKPNFYNIKLVLDNGICTYPDLCSADTTVVLSYPSWITQQRFGDVIALYNEKYNGGYQWSAYQWYHGDSLMEGETFEYLYVPTGLVVGDQYHVRLTREGETTDFQTCPITIVADPINNDYAPTMGYLSVTPTCVCPCSPYINILSRKDGTYRITAADGSLVREGVFRADVSPVNIPTIEGVYIVQLWSPDTPEEPYRVFKVLVSPKCPNYENMPF